MVGATISMVGIVTAFFVKKPADQMGGMAQAH
jgi:hypothetical protein